MEKEHPQQRDNDAKALGWGQAGRRYDRRMKMQARLEGSPERERLHPTGKLSEGLE